MIGIIGAGISGLVLGYELKKRGIPFKILEESDQPGGWILSTRDKNITREFGPNSLFTSPELESLIDELGLRQELIFANESSKNRFIVKNRKLQKLPVKPQGLLFNRALSFKSKLSIFKETRIKPFKRDSEPTFKEFFEDHFSSEVYNYLVDPFLTGVYAGDGSQLLVNETFPSLLEYEQAYGSIIKGLKKNKTLKKRSIVTFKKGLDTLTSALHNQIKDDVYLNTKIDTIDFSTKTIKGSQTLECSKIINTSSIERTLSLLNLPETERYSPSIAVGHVWLNKTAINKLPNAFGVLVPKKEYKLISGIIFNGQIFSSASSNEELLVTCIIGGVNRANHLKLNDTEVESQIQKEFQELFGIENEINRIELNRKERSIPQYTRPLKATRERVFNLSPEFLFHCANWSGGVSIPDRIKSAQSLSKKLVDLPTLNG